MNTKLSFINFIFLFIFTQALHAQEVSGWKKALIGPMSKIVGPEKAKNILRINESEIVIPAIPKLENEATSTKVYDRVNKENNTSYNKLSPKERAQFDYTFIKEMFLVVRNQQASDREISTLMNVLEQGGSRDGVYRSLVLDQHYTYLIDKEDPSSERLVTFVLDFLSRFLNLTTQKDALLKTNFYWLKRYVVEKALDIGELLIANPEDFYNWYALISADLSKQPGITWKNKARENTDPKWYKDWAKSVPEQHVKSELIVKLHLVMNTLK